MFNIGISELLLIGIVALVVIGPEKLPAVARTAGRWLGRMQRFVAGVKAELAQEFDLGELRQLKDEFEAQAIQMRTQMAGVQRQLATLHLEAGAPFPDAIPLPPTPEGDAHLQLELPLPPPPAAPARPTPGPLQDGQLPFNFDGAESVRADPAAPAADVKTP